LIQIRPIVFECLSAVRVISSLGRALLCRPAYPSPLLYFSLSCKLFVALMEESRTVLLLNQ